MRTAFHKTMKNFLLQQKFGFAIVASVVAACL